MEKFLKRFERFIVICLLGFMALVVLLSVVELAVLIFEQLMIPPFMLLDMNKLLKIFSFFLIVLIGLELIEVIKVYLVDEQVHVEVIFLVAIIAVARKVIILDVKDMDPLILVGVAAIILALSGGYLLLKQGLKIKTITSKQQKPEFRRQNLEGSRRKQEYRRQNKSEVRRQESGDRRPKERNQRGD
jgi:uncharacterized membrane protein (DUF373 family)